MGSYMNNPFFTLLKIYVWREKTAPALRILGLALGLVVFSVTTLVCVAEAFYKTFNQEASQLLGADLVLEAPTPLASVWQKKARADGLISTNMIEFFSMIAFSEGVQLANVIAVDNQYPLEGKLSLQGTASHYAPPLLGEIWMEESLVLKLGVALGEAVTVGNCQLTLTALVKGRPVATSGNSNFAGVAYVHWNDLPAMQVLRPGSRATYRLLLKGREAQQRNFESYFRAQTHHDVHLITTKTGRVSIERINERIQSYGTLIVFVQIVLAAISMAICARFYSIEQQRNVAILRALGASQKMAMLLPLFSLFLFSMLILLVSIGGGYVAAKVALFYAVQYGIGTESPGSQAAFLGFMTGIIMLLGIVMPSFLQLRFVMPKAVLQNSYIQLPYSILSYCVAALFLGALWFPFLGNTVLVFRMVGQFLLLLFLFFLLFQGIKYLFIPLLRKGGLTWRMGIGYLLRDPRTTFVQFLVFTMVVTFLLLIQIVQHEFINAWKVEFSSGTPNYFFINIQDKDIHPIRDWFQSRGMLAPHFYPILAARLTYINDEFVDDAIEQEKHTHPRGLNRPIYLTWMESLPKDNKFLYGKKWEKVEKGSLELSVEEGFATRQKLHLGDTLTFQVADKQIVGKIVQFRSVQWGSFQPNFFVIFPPEVLESFSHEYMTSIYLSPDRVKAIAEFSQSFAEVSIIDIDALLRKVQKIVKVASGAFSALLIFLLLFGLLIMYANILSTLKIRIQESALMKMLGADNRVILKILLLEFGILALISGAIGSLFALGVAYDLSQRYFAVSFHFKMWWLFLGVGGSGVFITCFGLLGTRSVFFSSPLRLFIKN